MSIERKTIEALKIQVRVSKDENIKLREENKRLLEEIEHLKECLNRSGHV